MATEAHNLTFAEALQGLQVNGMGAYIRIDRWPEDIKIHIQIPDNDSKNTAPYLFIESGFGRVPWVPTQVEMLTESWSLYTN